MFCSSAFHALEGCDADIVAGTPPNVAGQDLVPHTEVFPARSLTVGFPIFMCVLVLPHPP